MDLYSFLEPLKSKIREVLELVQVAMDENDGAEAKKLLEEAERLDSAKKNLMTAIHEKFGERLLTPETKMVLEGLGMQKKVHVDLKKEMEHMGLPEKEIERKNKLLENAPLSHKKPLVYTPPKPSEDLDEGPIDLTSSVQISFEKIAAGDLKSFKLLLSFLRALAHIYQYMHWRSAGTNYYGDHLLYERLYGSVESEIDPVAEKILGITDDSKSIHPIEDSKYTHAIVEKFVKGEFNPESFAEIAIVAEKELIKLIEKMMSSDQSDGVENMLQGIADKHEGHLYLLQQRNRTASAKIVALVKMANKLDAAGEFQLANSIDELISLYASTKSKDEIEAERDMILEQIHKIETRKPLPFEDESNYKNLQFLREKYRELEKELHAVPDEDTITTDINPEELDI